MCVQFGRKDVIIVVVCNYKYIVSVCVEILVVVVMSRNKHSIPNCESACTNPKMTTGLGEHFAHWIKCLAWALDR